MRAIKGALAGLALLALPGWGIPALAAKSYGAAAGVALPLAPVGRPGVAIGISAVIGADDPDLEGSRSSLLRARGEIVGIIAGESKAILPTLSADVGLAAGPVELFGTGGVQIFGGAWRGDYGFFTTFGLLGGGGATVAVHPRLRIELRGIVTWLPDFAAARVRGPEEGEHPTLLFFSGLLGVVYSP